MAHTGWFNRDGHHYPAPLAGHGVSRDQMAAAMGRPDPMDDLIYLKAGSEEWKQWVDFLIVSASAWRESLSFTGDTVVPNSLAFRPKPGGFAFGIAVRAPGGVVVAAANYNYILMAFPQNPRQVYEVTDQHGMRPDAMDSPPAGP